MKLLSSLLKGNDGVLGSDISSTTCHSNGNFRRRAVDTDARPRIALAQPQAQARERQARTAVAMNSRRGAGHPVEQT